MLQEFNATYWQNRNRNAQTGWDTAKITPPLQDYFDQLTNKELSLLVPGCGNAWEAEYLYRAGFKHVVLADFAEEPLQNFVARVPDFPQKQLFRQDFFELSGQYDLIVEQTFFCAIDPAQRLTYAQKCAELLVPGGKLVGVLFVTEFQQPGPPFGGNRDEYRTYFAPYFRFLHFETAYNSIAPRQGRELFICLQKL